MSTFLTIKKTFDLSASNNTKMLAGRHRYDFPTPGYEELPYDAQVEYLESVGTSWIDTGLSVTNNVGYQVEVEFQFLNFSTGTVAEDWVFGYWNSSPSSRLYLIGRYTSYIRGGAGPDTSSYHADIDRDTLKHRIALLNSGAYVDGIYKCSTNLSQLPNPYGGQNTILLGKSPHVDNGSTRRIFSCRMWSIDGQLLRDFIPVRVGNVGCMYDKVSKQLFGNQGSISFGIGKDIVPIEHIESTGTQWIDTEIAPTSDLGANFKFNVTQLTSDGIAYWSPVFGADEGWPDGNGFGVHIRDNRIKFGSQTYSYSFSINVDYVVNLQDKIVSVNNQQVLQSSETFSASRSMYLFANNRGDDIQTSIAKFYYCSFYQSGTLACDMIPVRIGQVGYMYDKVTNRLFENKGTGDFVLGDDLVTYKFRYLRMNIAELRSTSTIVIQLSRLDLKDSSDNVFTWPSEATVSCTINGQVSTGSSSERPANIIDGSTSTKYCSGNWSSHPVPCVLTIDLGASNTVDIATYCQWCWYTANDANDRDPVTFSLEASNDGQEWAVLDSVTNASITTTRKALAYTGDLLVPNAAISQQPQEASEDENLPAISTIKKHFDYTVDVAFDSNGGTSCESATYTLGQLYGNLPEPTKASHIFKGWYTSLTGEVEISDDSFVELSNTVLYAHWQYADVGDDYTEYVVQTTSSYKKTGIYSATRYDSTSSIVIDWGDGNVETIDGDISQVTHEYSSVSSFHVKVNNTSNFQPSYNNSTWYSTTSQNRYTFKDVVKTGSHCTTFNAYAFYYCAALSSIGFLSSCFTGLTYVPSNSFYNCTSITQLSSLPARIKYLGASSFRYCTGLTGIQDLRNTGLTSFTNSYIFANCTNVKEFKLPDNIGTSIGSYMFQQDTGLSSVTIPTSLTTTGAYSWHSCTSLKSLTIPSNIKTIGNQAFRGCTQLSSVTYETTALTSIGQYAFYQCHALRDLTIPNTVKLVGNYAFYYCYNSSASSLVLPSALTSIGTYSYCYCYNLKEVTIPSSVASIGNNAFSGCYKLSLIVDYRLTAQSVGSYTFGNTTGTGTGAYTGYSTMGSNVLCVSINATGYDSGYWLDPLQNASKCGFTLDYYDKTPVTVTFDATTNGGQMEAGAIIPTYFGGAMYGSFPAAEHPTKYFDGWYDGNVRVDITDIVPLSGAALVARYMDDPVEIAYIEGTGDQWINTGILQGNNQISVNYKQLQYQEGAPVFGTYLISSGTDRSDLFAYEDGITVGLGNGLSAIKSQADLTNNHYAVFHTAEIDKDAGIVKLDGITIGSGDPGSDATSNDAYYTLFRRTSASGSYTVNAHMYLASFQVKSCDTGNMLFNGIPVRVGYSGYIKDTVSGNTFGNANTSSASKFIAGPEKIPQPTAIEYLEFNPSYPNARIDALTDVSDAGKWDIDVQILGSGGCRFVNGTPSSDGEGSIILAAPNSGTSYYPYKYSSWNDPSMSGVDLSEKNNVVFEFSRTRRTIYVNSVQKAQGTTTTYPSANSTIILFRPGLNSGGYNSRTVRIYECKIYDSSNNLIRDLVPVRIDSIGMMFDQANPKGGPNGDGLFYNSSTDPFSLGNDV